MTRQVIRGPQKAGGLQGKGRNETPGEKVQRDARDCQSFAQSGLSMRRPREGWRPAQDNVPQWTGEACLARDKLQLPAAVSGEKH